VFFTAARPHAAGIDVSSTEMQVCVPDERDADNNRRFGTFTEDLHKISSWLKASSREVLHMQKSMELMNIKLVNVISDVLGKSGQAIIKGERNASLLASLADPRCKSPKEIIEKSLAANWDEDLVFMLGQSYKLYHFYQGQMKECDKK
jgi:hypothetical protein